MSYSCLQSGNFYSVRDGGIDKLGHGEIAGIIELVKDEEDLENLKKNLLNFT